MKTINVFVADDGSRFGDEARCVAYESQCAECAAIMARLKPLPKDDGCRFANGGGYIQHDAATLKSVRDYLSLLFERTYGPMPTPENNWYAQTREKDADSSWVGRLIGDSGHRAFHDAWYRIQCCDGQAREWGQPYYASHPDKGKQFDVYATEV